MNVDGISLSQTATQLVTNTETVQEESPVEIEAPEVVENPESEEKVSSVIRLLQAGHFKGVADIRLRINFYNELLELEEQNLKATASDGFEEFNQIVQEQIAGLNESGLLDEDQTTALETFSENIESVQTGFLESEGPSVESLAEGLQNDLDSIIALLNPSTPASEEEIPETPVSESPTESIVESPAEEITPLAAETQPVPAEPAEEANSLQQLIQSFQETLQTLIDALGSDLANTSALPPVSAPSGNGQAYAKFMSIYESMLISPTNIEPGEQLDVIEVPILEEGEIVTETTEL
ncbi:MAG: hypothetical protein H8E62_11345 [Planctomycetes bacterium]|nr:hypothetical protein [Planctomycetota bacterium]